MADGTNVGGIWYDCTLETAGLIAAQRKIEQALRKAGDAGDGLQSRFKAIAAGISAALASIGVKQLVDKLVAVQREFDVLFSSLKTAVGGSVDVAQAQFERLQRFAEETPYSLQQAVQGYTKLVNLGLDPSERAMRSFGNTASAMGKDLMQMIEAVADASTGEMERLKEFGITSKDEGSKVILTFRNVKTEVAKNSQAITEYLVKLGETNFGGAMVDRTKTLDGAIGALADKWDALFRAVSQSGAGDAIAAGVRKATEAIAQAEASVKRGQLTEYFDAVRPALQAAEVAAVSLAGAVAGKLVTSFVASTSALVSKTIAARAAATQAVALAEAELAAATAAQREAQAQYGLTGSLAAVTAASARTTAAQAALTAAQTAAARTATVAGVASRGAAAIIGALGGPIGIAITGLTLLALNWDRVGLQAKSAATIAEESAQRIRAALSRTGGAPMASLQQQAEAAQKGMADIDAQIARAESKAPGGGYGKQKAPDTSGLLARREAYRESYVQTLKAIEDLKEIQRKENDGPEELKAPKVKQEPDKSVLAKAQEAKAYYEQTVAANAQGLAKINAEEQQALADNKKRQIEDKDNAAVYQKARTEIVARFARERARLEEQNTRTAAEAQIATITDTEQQIVAIRDETLRQANQDYALGVKSFEEAEAAKLRAIMDAMAQQKALQQQRQQTQVQTLQIRAQTTGNPADQEAAIRAGAQAQVDALNERAQADLANAKDYADQKVEVYAAAEQQIQDLQAASTLAQLAMAQSAAGQMLGVLQKAGKERTAMGKALFLAERALAVASIIISTEQGAQKAVGMAGPFGIPMATLIRAQGYASAGMVAGLAIADTFGGGRQYGGPVSAGTMYRVNETGAPEMYTASNGRQFMLPTSGGRVTPADQVGGGAAPTVIIQNMGAPMAVQDQSWDARTRTMIMTLAPQAVAAQIAERRGEVWGALRTTNVQGRPG